MALRGIKKRRKELSAVKKPIVLCDIAVPSSWIPRLII
jgi:hypothetical protein